MRLVGIQRRRNALGQKHCPACVQWLDPSAFPSKKGASDGLQAKCNPCLLKYNRAVKYGITIQRIDDMYAAQNGMCAICFSGIGTDCHIDHDHNCCPGYRSCGKCVRGLLCNSCNLMLGMAKDSPEILLSASAYLKRY